MILFDEPVYNFLFNLYSEKMTFIMRLLTSLGSTLVIISGIISILFLFDFKHFKQMTIISLIGIISNHIIKEIVKRPRPSVFKLTSESSYSFPSSHTMMSTIFYGLLIYFIWEKLKNRKLKILLTIIFSIIILGTGISRIYLGAHYATDVLAGLILGLLYDFFFIKLYINKKNKETKRT